MHRPVPQAYADRHHVILKVDEGFGSLVENFWVRLKEWRAGATQYEKTVASFSLSFTSPQSQIGSRSDRA